jgi:pimeloyl-ACP methyl ester carboxylesterase
MPPPFTGLRKLHARANRDQVYYLYVPWTYDGTTPYRLLVSMHGSGRTAETYAERFVEFANWRRYIVLAPLFPDDLRYQQLGIDDDFRADRRLLQLVDEVATMFRIQKEQFDLFGYSGGGQFTHRFLYVHPERLRSVAVGAPGTVTLPSARYDWPSGIADFQKKAGRPFDLQAVSRPRLMLIIGAEDTTSENLNESDDAMRLGKHRLARARAMHAAWLQVGIDHQYIEVPKLGHELDDRILNVVRRFLAS